MATTASDIQALYVAYFNRPAEPTGLAFWLARANANGGVNYVANEFANSQEYKDTYAGKSNLAIVDQIYLNLFGRHAEAAGLVYWAGKLDSGELKFGNVALIISQSAQGADLVAVQSKISAATQFTSSLTTGDEILGYDGTAANAVLKAWLAGINTDAQLKAATTTTALDSVAASAAAAKDLATATPAVLTTGVDTITGTAGNDIINATGKTFTALDSIDGSTGSNTLNIVDADATQGTGLPGLVTLKNIQKINVVTTGTIGNVAATTPAVAEVKTYTFTDPAATGHELDVSVAGGTATTTGDLGADATSAAAAFAAIVNTLYGATIAVAAAGVVTITAPVAGTPLPSIAITLGTGALAGDIPAVATTTANAAAVVGTDVVYDLTGDAALTTLTASANGSVNVKVGAAVASTVTTTKGAVTVSGGVSVKSTGATAAESFTGAALTSVDATGGTSVTANDLSSGTSTGTLKSVALTSNNGAAVLTGDQLTTVSLTKSKGSVSIVNGTLKHTLTLNTNDVGNDTGPAYLQVVDNNAAVINLTNSGAKATTTSFLNLDSTGATKLAVTNSADLTLDAGGLTNLTSLTVAGAGSFTSDVQTLANLVTIDASASTGANDLTVAGATVGIVVKGGSGDDSVTVIGALDAKAAITLGAGNDTYTFSTAAAAGATVSGGEGTDTLAVADGSKIDADAAKVYSGFEVLDVTKGTGHYDMSILGLTAVVLNDNLTGATFIDSAAAGTTISITSKEEAALVTGQDLNFALKTATGTNDTLTLNLTAVDGNDDGTASGSVTVTKLIAADIENIKIASSVAAVDADDASTQADESTTADEYTNTITDMTVAAAKTVTITGNAHTVITALNDTVLTKFDASATTGGVELLATDSTKAVTFIGGSGKDVYVGTDNGDTISGGAGADTITLGTGAKDTLVYLKSSDSVLSLVDTNADGTADALDGFDVVGGFVSATDKVDLSGLGLASGTVRGAITVKSAVADFAFATVKDFLANESADFFNDGVADRAVAFVTDGTDGFLFVDTNKDGNFNAGTDLAIKLLGVTALQVTDISFG